jgi:CDP-glucose 4,6-dehydratase
VGVWKCSLGQNADADIDMVDRAFWSGQRVLLTGHTGFKGGWLSVWLASMGAQVWGLSLRPDTTPNLFDLIPSAAFRESRYGDIRDQSVVASFVADAKPTIAIHMAAQALVRRSYGVPAETFATNVMGTVHVLEALRGQRALKAVVVVTTDKVYRNPEDGRAFREDDPLGAHDPYSASKAAAEIAVSSWAQSYFAPARIPVVAARAGNVIGGGDWSEDRLVPDIWRAAQRGETLLLRYPNATRPWQHAIEPLAGYLRYAEAAASGAAVPEALNFGPIPEDTLTVRALAEAMLKALGTSATWKRDPTPAAPEMQALALDPSLAGKSIGWRPRLSSAEAIAWTAEWYGRLAQGEPAHALCLEQISRYEKLL